MEETADKFLKFVNASPSPWHAVHQVILRLKENGFSEIKVSDSTWKISKLGKYFMTKNKSTIIAIVIGGKYVCGSSGFSIVAAHTDSPCPRVKPVSKKSKINYDQIGVEMYGGGIWYTWFDRDLTLAGRVIVQKNNELLHKLYDAKLPILRIPTLAIHLNHEYSEKWVINRENHLAPIIGLKKAEGVDHNKPKIESTLTNEIKGKIFSDGHNKELMKSISESLNVSPADIIDMELCLADTQPACIGGINHEFIFSARLDNLMGSYTALQGFLESLSSASLESDPNIRVLALYDNEEVGSESAQGASSAFTSQVFKRLTSTKISCHEDTTNKTDKSLNDGVYGLSVSSESLYEKAIAKSFLVSSDQSHAIHPNYADKHEENHQIKLDGGFVIKHNANQRYATTAITSAVLKTIAQKRGLPLQEYVVRNDSTCGSTIGPIQSALLGIPTVDVGGPQLSMHSIRETCAAISVSQGTDIFKAFYEEFPKLDLKNLLD